MSGCHGAGDDVTGDSCLSLSTRAREGGNDSAISGSSFCFCFFFTLDLQTGASVLSTHLAELLTRELVLPKIT